MTLARQPYYLDRPAKGAWNASFHQFWPCLEVKRQPRSAKGLQLNRCLLLTVLGRDYFLGLDSQQPKLTDPTVRAAPAPPHDTRENTVING